MTRLAGRFLRNYAVIFTRTMEEGMPTMLFSEHHRAQLSHRLRRAMDDTRSRARRAAHSRRNGLRAVEQKGQMETANSSLASVDVHRKTMYMWLLFCMASVYGIDVLLFASVAEYFVKQGFANSPGLARVAQFLLPAFIVVVEMVVSMQRDAAYREYLDGFGSRYRFWAWAIISTFCALVMPLAVIAIFVAGEGKDFTPLISIPLIFTLAGLSLICHILMLFGGRLALESKAWITFRLQMIVIETRQRRCNRTYATHSQVAADRFAQYLQDLTTHNNAYSSARIEAGPFDRDTREIVNDVYGYEVIKTPAIAPAEQNEAQSRPLPTAAANTGADTVQDWTAYQRQVLDQDVEVRP